MGVGLVSLLAGTTFRSSDFVRAAACSFARSPAAEARFFFAAAFSAAAWSAAFLSAAALDLAFFAWALAVYSSRKEGRGEPHARRRRPPWQPQSKNDHQCPSTRVRVQ